MVVKSATKKKLMDVGVDEEYAHQLAWERKWQGVVVLSPRNILTNLFGASTWNEDPDFNSAKKPNLNRAYPLRLSQMERLSPRGAKHLEIVNDIYKKVHGIETVKQYREERSGVPFGIINHPRLFRYEVYEYTFRHRKTKEVIDGFTPKKHRIYSRRTWVGDMPHEKHREQQEKFFNRYTDNQGRQQQY